MSPLKMPHSMPTGGTHSRKNTQAGQSTAGNEQWLPGRAGIYDANQWREEKGSSQVPVRVGVGSTALPSWTCLISEAKQGQPWLVLGWETRSVLKSEVYPPSPSTGCKTSSLGLSSQVAVVFGDNVPLHSWPRPLYVVQASLQLPAANASEEHTGGAGWDTLTLGLPESFLGPPSSTCLGHRSRQPCQGCTSVRWLKGVEPLQLPRQFVKGNELGGRASAVWRGATVIEQMGCLSAFYLPLTKPCEMRH